MTDYGAGFLAGASVSIVVYGVAAVLYYVIGDVVKRNRESS